MEFIYGFMIGSLLSAIIHYFYVRHVGKMVEDISQKYSRLLEIIQLWQKKI